MTAEEFHSRVERLIISARDQGLSDGVILAQLQELADALRDGYAIISKRQQRPSATRVEHAGNWDVQR